MLKTGDVLDFGPLGMNFYIKETAADTDGQVLGMEWELDAGTGGTPVHIHPHAVETYQVLEGQLDVYVDGTWKTLPAGKDIAVPKGMPHTFRNASDETTRVYNTHQPAMRFDQYFEGLSRLANSDVVKSNQMTFRAMLYLSVLMTGYREEIESVKPPDAVVQLLGFIGRLLGYGV